MNKIKKIFSRIERFFIRSIVFWFSLDSYLHLYQRWLAKNGILFDGKVKFINPDVYFDGTDYRRIKIGNNVTISREVMLLIHDYSLTNAFCAMNNTTIKRHKGEVYLLGNIEIGENSFIGARASILPGTTIGKNCIIGACTVVKGDIPDNSICIGNPCKIIGSTVEYAKKHLRLKDYLEGSL